MWIWIRRLLVLVACVLALLAAAVAGTIIFERHRLAQFNRTYQTPLKFDRNGPVLVEANRLLAMLAPFDGSNSLRFAAMPSFGDRWFAVGLRKDGNQALVKVAIEHRPSGPIVTRAFNISGHDFDRMMAKWDLLTDGYSGEGRSLTDGTPLAFERRRGDQFTSGVGNAPCHYDVLGDLAAQMLAQHVHELNDLRQPDLPQLLASDYC